VRTGECDDYNGFLAEYLFAPVELSTEPGSKNTEGRHGGRPSGNVSPTASQEVTSA